MDRRVLWALAELDIHLDRVNPADLARRVNLSLSRFAHLFTAETGLSPSRYAHALRMERARTLLERTFLTVKEVMAQVGISDATHFSRDFHRYHGLPPSRIRWGAASRGESTFLSMHLRYLERKAHQIAVAADSAKKK